MAAETDIEKTLGSQNQTDTKGGNTVYTVKDATQLSTTICTQPVSPESTMDELDKGKDSDKDTDTDSIRSIGNQTNVLPTRKLLVAFPALSVALFVSVIDQTSVSTSIPAISSELNTGSATSWIGGSFLLASTAFQLINGRISDIFGRKNCLLFYISLLALGDLICGFSVRKEMLFAARAIAGIGGGGLVSVCLIIISDIVALENRGKFQGMQCCTSTSKSSTLTYTSRHNRCCHRNGQW